MLSPLPRRSHWRYGIAHPSSGVSLPRKGDRVGLRIVLFEACSAFTRVTACTLALSPYFVTCLTEGFNHFVTSIVAPVLPAGAVAGWGLHPLEKRRLITAHTRSGPSRESFDQSHKAQAEIWPRSAFTFYGAASTCAVGERE